MWVTLCGLMQECEVAVQHMDDFEREMAALKIQSCVVCHESRIVECGYSSEECPRCASSKCSPKKFSEENNMIPCPVPPELQGLTPVEELMIAKAVSVMRCYYKKGGQRGYSGLSLPQEVNEFAKRLPRPVQEIPMVFLRRHGIDDTFKDFVVRKIVLWNALVWLKQHNPFYSDIEIDEVYLQNLPTDGVPSGVQNVDTCICTACFTCLSCHKCTTCQKCVCGTPPNADPPFVFNANNFESEQKQEDLNASDRSFLLGGSDEINQDEFLRQKILEDSVFGTKQNPVPWESSKTPANEFRTKYVFSHFVS